MARLHALVLKRDLRAILEGLGTRGVVHLTVTAPGPDHGPMPPEDTTSARARWESLRSRIAEVRRQCQALGSDVDGAVGGAIEDVAGLAQRPKTLEAEVEGIEERLRSLMARRAAAFEREERWTRLLESLGAYGRLELPVETLRRSGFLHLAVGQLPSGRLARLQEVLRDGVVLWWNEQESRHLALVVAATGERGEAMQAQLAEAGFVPAGLPPLQDEVPARIRERALRELEAVRRELGEMAGEVARCIADLTPRLGPLERCAERELRLLEAADRCAQTSTAVSLTGWVARARLPEVKATIDQLSGGRCVIESPEPMGDGVKAIPTLLGSPGWMRGFESLVTAYGLPAYREVVPTLFVAVTYPLMFGFMFGDIGHGALLFVAGWVAVWRLPTRPRLRAIGFLLGVAGLASAGFGWVYGSFFGLPAFKSWALWRDPIEADPWMLIRWTLGFGMAVISGGLLLNIFNRFRQGDLIGALFDKFGLAGLLFYWTAIVLVTAPGVHPSGWLLGVAPALLGLALLGWAMKAPIEHLHRRRASPPADSAGEGWGAIVAESLVGTLEGVLVYLANTVSFVRLAAYALSHAALLMATLGLASLAESVAGTASAILVIVLGNLVTLALEGIVAAVQALRLEYYEFFGKFFAGSGHPFTPFVLPVEEAA